MRLRLGLIVALVLIALIGLLLHRRSASQQALRAAQQSIRQMAGYSSDADYFEQLTRRASSDAMSDAYSPPTASGKGRMSTGGTDHRRYLQGLIRSMIDKAEADGKPEAAGVLRSFYKSQFGIEPK